MPRILVTGALGQIGTELIEELRHCYGRENVIASDIRQVADEARRRGPYVYLDVLDKQEFRRIVVEHDIDWIVHNASILSAVGEKNPDLALNINTRGVENALDVAKRYQSRIFIPSSIAAFGSTTPQSHTPDTTIMRPNTMYGITKVWAELLGEYYHKRWGVDFRSLRYPGIISYKSLPGGGTTDYAVEIYYEALRHQKYTSFLAANTLLPMMYMPDCLKGTIDLLSADKEVLKQQVFNISALSFTPQQVAEEIQKYIPEFEISYQPDYRQQIADSWPNSLDDTAAREQWGWQHQYELDGMTKDMIIQLGKKLQL